MNFRPLNLIGIGHFLSYPHWRPNAHEHAFHELIIIMAGIMHVEVGRQTVAADSGTVLLYPPGVGHKEWSDTDHPFESYYISFKGTTPALSTFRMKQDASHRIRQLTGWLFTDYTQREARRQHANLLFLQLIIEEFFAPDYNSAGYNLIAATRDIILNDIAKPLLLDQLAKQVGLSKYHFIRKFKRLAGRTPMAEARALRADYAKDLLLTTDLPLKEIAIKAGLCDEYALSHVFRLHFGMPPGSFRKQHSH